MSAVHPLFESLIRPVRPDVQFMFDGIAGRVDGYDYVSWGGMGFSVTSAGPELRAAIDAARSRSIMVEVPRVCIEEAIRAMADAHSIMQGSRPSTWSPSLTEQRLNYAIEELKQCANQR